MHRQEHLKDKLTADINPPVSIFPPVILPVADTSFPEVMLVVALKLLATKLFAVAILVALEVRLWLPR